MTPVTLPADLAAMLRRPSSCFLTTLMPDGSPQLTLTWVDTDGTNILINSVRGHQTCHRLQPCSERMSVGRDGAREVAGRQPRVAA